ncbi:hypothetical protein CAS74_004260 [Pichia kudriavzevii]|uniref:Uncharacterized protein n=1 Tax=Pichia kudriavzevii TaxID=4909 RepID=A0A1Z8JJ30_PICKU|nr:hypothetical protein CAS74_004260 [Pichia kudriavzevii]
MSFNVFNDGRVSRKLHRISQLYQIQPSLHGESAVIHSFSDLSSYKSLILPSSQSVTTSAYDDEPNYNHRSLSSNNGGIPINNLSKIPSYQWGFKHEDELQSDLSAEINENQSSLGSFNGTSVSSLARNVTSNTSMGLNSRMVRLPIKNSNSENVNLFDISNYKPINGVIQGGECRSLMNGLPYYNLKDVEKIIRDLNLTKKLNFKASNTNTSWFSDTLNSTIDEIEYLHGEVILNQFINNKRLIRNYQWLIYLTNIKTTSILNDQNNANINNNEVKKFYTMKDFKKWLRLKTLKFNELQKEKNQLLAQLEQIKLSKQTKRSDYKLKFSKLPQNLSDDEIDIYDYNENYSTQSNGKDNLNLAIQVYGEELINRERELRKKLLKIPEFLEEVDIADLTDDHDDENDSRKNSENNNNIPASEVPKFTRFNSNKSYNENHEYIIEREIPIDDPKLMDLQTKLYGHQRAQKLQNEVYSRNGLIKSKNSQSKRLGFL